MARPKKEIDLQQFEELCKIQCTKDEICAVFRIDEKTLTRICHEHYNEGFSVIYKKLSKAGLQSLRRAQWKKAVVDENTTMQIWLGKQYLGQRDKLDQTSDDGVKAYTEELKRFVNKL